MGRSVISYSDATAVAYSTFDMDVEYYQEIFDENIAEEVIDEDTDFDTWAMERWSFDAEFEWTHYVESIQERVQELWPSFEVSSDYDHNSEQRIIMKNAHSIVSISEYCGAVAISLAPNYDRKEYWKDPEEFGGLGAHWRSQIAEKFEKEFGTMRKVGAFSNGEVVFRFV